MALKFLRSLEPALREIVDVAGRGDTPGWDIEYVTCHGRRHFVEVKGTTGKRFADICLTANEWAAARAKGELYRLLLVADCLCERPLLQFVDVPHPASERGALSVEPAVFSIRRVSS